MVQKGDMRMRENSTEFMARVALAAIRGDRTMDEIFTRSLFYGSRRIAVTLQREGWNIGRDKVRSLMRKMRLEAIYPKINLSKRNKAQRLWRKPCRMAVLIYLTVIKEYSLPVMNSQIFYCPGGF